MTALTRQSQNSEFPKLLFCDRRYLVLNWMMVPTVEGCWVESERCPLGRQQLPAPPKIKRKSCSKPQSQHSQPLANMGSSFHSQEASSLVSLENNDLHRNSRHLVLYFSYVCCFLKKRLNQPWFDFCRSGPDADPLVGCQREIGTTSLSERIIMILYSVRTQAGMCQQFPLLPSDWVWNSIFGTSLLA